MQIADRIKKLGTETAFAVSSEAAAHKEKGNKVYPFHLGDINLSTPRNIVEASFEAIKNGKTGYCSNMGIPELRDALARNINGSHRTNYTRANVAVQPGGKPTISKFIMALMNPGDEVLYPNPGYPIYESQINFYRGKLLPYRYIETKQGFDLDLAEIEKSITPKTKILIINDPQNPIGAELSAETRRALAKLAVEKDLMVLLDEAYFDMRYSGRTVSLVEEPGMINRSVLLYTFSKKFAMTGWRLGAALGPEEVINTIGKLNTNDESCSNHFIQYGVLAGLSGDQGEVNSILQCLKKRRDLCVQMLNQIAGVVCHKPETTFYLFPNVTGAMKNKGFSDLETFRKAALRETGVSFCTRNHFGTPLAGETEKYIRFAYSGINEEEIQEGLDKFQKWLS